MRKHSKITNIPQSAPRKPLYWTGSSLDELREMPEDVQDVFGRALLDAQCGDVPFGARPFGEGVRREVWKIAEDHQAGTYRMVYTVHFKEAVYVLDVFQKKSTRGIATPQRHRDRVMQRFKEAKQHYRITHPADSTP